MTDTTPARFTTTVDPALSTPTPATKRPRRLTDEQRGERQRERFDARFIAAVHTTEKRAALVNAYVIIDPAKPEKWGRVVITRGQPGGSVLAVAWLPRDGGRYEGRHTNRAHGGGFDMASAAMAGASYTRPDGVNAILHDDGQTWDRQLQDAGFIVIQAC